MSARQKTIGTMTTQKGRGHHRRRVCSFSEDMKYFTSVAVLNCHRKGVAEPQTEECNRLHMWGSSFYILGTTLFSKVVT
jgi:hypothetical protein